MLFPFRSRRPKADLHRPRRCRPRLEVLEDRCVPTTVMNLLDSGSGSLRQAILDTPAGGTVDFQPGLSGTITLTSGELAIGNDLTIAGPGADIITVSGNHASRVFDITAASHVAPLGTDRCRRHVRRHLGRRDLQRGHADRHRLHHQG